MKRHEWNGKATPRSALHPVFKTRVIKPGDPGWSEAPLASGEVPSSPKGEDLLPLNIEEVE